MQSKNAQTFTLNVEVGRLSWLEHQVSNCKIAGLMTVQQIMSLCSREGQSTNILADYLRGVED